MPFPPDMGSLLSAAQQFKGQLESIRSALQEKMVEVRAADGAICVTVDGQQKVRSVRVDPGLFTQHGEDQVAEMIAGAVNQALQESGKIALSTLGSMMGGADLASISGMLMGPNAGSSGK